MQQLAPENVQQLMETIQWLKENFRNVRIEHEPAGIFLGHPREYTTEELKVWPGGGFLQTINIGFDREGDVYVGTYQVTADDSAVLGTNFLLEGNTIVLEARTGAVIKTTRFMFS